VADAFQRWMASLEERHLADLTFSEVSRSLRALSSTYVERRRRIAEGGALSGAGKRAAFALFYGPLHYLLIRHIVGSLPGAAAAPPKIIVDLGCGTGAAGAAWASACHATPAIVGIDRHPWALGEAARTYRDFGLAGRTRKGDIAVAPLPGDRTAVVAAFAMNELTEAAREALVTRLVGRAGLGNRLLIVEPLAGFVAPWWNRWRERFEDAGGRADQWRFRADLPPIVEKLDRAAGLDHRDLTGRSLWLSGGS
jgi:SAM-dependent methyltransferase